MTILESFGVPPMVEKMVENKLRWFGHIERIHVDFIVMRIDQMERNQITRDRGKPKKTIRETIKISRLTNWIETLFWIEHYDGIWSK